MYTWFLSSHNELNKQSKDYSRETGPIVINKGDDRAEVIAAIISHLYPQNGWTTMTDYQE